MNLGVSKTSSFLGHLKLLLTSNGSIGNIPVVGTSTKFKKTQNTYTQKAHKMWWKGRIIYTLVFLVRMGYICSSDKTDLNLPNDLRWVLACQQVRSGRTSRGLSGP